VKILDEVAPPGGLVQMKLSITEPMPITTGGARFSFDNFDSIEGISLSSPHDDTYGVAVFEGKTVGLSFVSASGTFGMTLDYPVLTFVGKVPADAPLGATFGFGVIGGVLDFYDTSGTRYPYEFRPGLLEVAPVASVHDVLPGSADLQAGDVVTVLGSGFDRRTKFRLDETRISDVTIVDSGTALLRLGGPANMHGLHLKVIDKDGDKVQVDYFSYHRTKRTGASDDYELNAVVPVLPKLARTETLVDIHWFGTRAVAIQNSGPTDAVVTADWVNAAGEPVSLPPFTTTPVPADSFVVRSVWEIGGVMPSDAAALRLTSSVPVQVMGVTWDMRPQLPR
jgi:hypothetical protein